ncbi:MAG: hypothetical protein RR847_02740 [Bacilli bacterium]
MDVLMINIKDFIYYVVIIICLVIIAFILLKFHLLKKEEQSEVVVNKIDDVKAPIKKTDVDSNQPKSDLEQVILDMQKDLNQDKDITQVFEEEQEDKAIISYQELVRANLKQEIKEDQLDFDLKDIPVLSEDLAAKEAKKYKNTGFISPIYGTMDIKSIPRKPDVAKETVIEKTLSKALLSEEKKKNDDFLRSLKEFRNNL